MSSINEIDRYNITEILLKVALNIIALTPRNRLSKKEKVEKATFIISV
jgi:hypothetical protein